MARFTTGLSGNPVDTICIFAHPQYTVYCLACAGWRNPLVHSLRTGGRHQCFRHFTICSASLITGVWFDGQATGGSRERYEFC